MRKRPAGVRAAELRQMIRREQRGSWRGLSTPYYTVRELELLQAGIRVRKERWPTAPPATEEDLRWFQERRREAASLPPSAPSRLEEIREQHHRMARMVAAGESDEAIMEALGHTPGFVRMMRRDVLFQALVAHYGG